MARVMESGRAIRLEAKGPLERRLEWRTWKPRGFRVLDADGVTVWHEREAIRRLVLEAFEGYDADIFLFGSRASGEARERSDYDVGYISASPLPAERLSWITERLEELPIPSHVELVDFQDVAAEFSEAVLKRKELEVWKTRHRKSHFTSKS